MKKQERNKVTSTLAKTDDGTIQITLTIPQAIITKQEEEELGEIAKETEIPGFRKGKAPLAKVKENTPQKELLEKVLGKVLPKAFFDSAAEHKIKPIIYPHFEAISIEEGKDWQVRATTCEIPEIELGDYKNLVRPKNIWTPGKDNKEKVPSAQEKEQIVLKALSDGIKVKIPSILIKEEVDSRLSSLLERIERLGLSLESYLASTGKNPESLRREYEEQARASISLDLILSKIAQDQGVEIPDSQVDEAIAASAAGEKSTQEMQTPERRRLIKNLLARKSALDSLIVLL